MVERCQITAALQSGRRYDNIVIANHLARRFQIGPDAGLFAGRSFSLRNDWKQLQNRLQVSLASHFSRPGCAFHTGPQFGHPDGGYFKLLSWLGGQPTFEIKCFFLAANDDIRIQNYRHLSAGALRFLRTVCKSRRQATASSLASPILANAVAKSRPVQTFSLSGGSRATGEPFLSRTKVVF